MSDYNLDTVDDSGYAPVTVTYKGTEYKLGASAYGLMMAPGVVALKGKTDEEMGAALVEVLPELLRLLSPDLAEALDDPSLAEQIALINAVTEVLNRLGRFRATPDAE